MDYKIKFTKHAKQDLEHIYTYIFETSLSKKIAYNFLNYLKTRISCINKFPKKCQKLSCNEEYKRLVLKDYCIIFSISEKDKEVVIERIFSNYMDFYSKL